MKQQRAYPEMLKSVSVEWRIWWLDLRTVKESSLRRLIPLIARLARVVYIVLRKEFRDLVKRCALKYP